MDGSAGQQDGAAAPGPAEQAEADDQRGEVDGQFEQAGPAGQPPDAVLEVVQGVDAEQVDAGAAAGQQPEQGAGAAGEQRDGGAEQADQQPGVGQREGVLELDVAGAGLAG